MTSNPADALAIATPDTEVVQDLQWFVVRTRSRQEKALAEDLEARGMDYFLPLVPRVSYYGRRKVERTVPLFAGYIFIHSSVEDAFGIDRTDRTAQLIRVTDQHRLAHELAQIRRAIEEGMDLVPHAYLPAGTPVVVRSGPLKGMQGIVDHASADRRLVLQVEVLGQATSLEIDQDLLDRLDD